MDYYGYVPSTVLEAAALPLTEKEFFTVSSTPDEDLYLILRPLDQDHIAILDRNRRLILHCRTADLWPVLTYLTKARPKPRIASTLDLSEFSL